MLGVSLVTFGREYYQKQICFNQIIFACFNQVHFKMKALKGLTLLLVWLLKKFQAVCSGILILKKLSDKKSALGQRYSETQRSVKVHKISVDF